MPQVHDLDPLWESIPKRNGKCLLQMDISAATGCPMGGISMEGLETAILRPAPTKAGIALFHRLRPDH
jgi:hypothetical protein